MPPRMRDGAGVEQPGLLPSFFRPVGKWTELECGAVDKDFREPAWSHLF
jgi:hypothetical protein